MTISIVFVLTAVVIFFVGFLFGLKYSNREIIKLSNLATKHLELLKIVVWWMKNPQKIKEYLGRNHYEKIAIYGMSYLGDCLENVLRNSGIKVVCGVDKNAAHLYNSHISIYTLEDKLPVADVIIITTIGCYEQIMQEVREVYGNDVVVVSLEKILHE